MRNHLIMNQDVFRNNLLTVLQNFSFSGKPVFKITPVYDPEKAEGGDDSVFRLVILNENNIGGRVFSLETAVEILTSMLPKIPTKIVVRYCGKHEKGSLFELETSTRIRKLPQVANMNTGHPPVQAVQIVEKGNGLADE